MNTTLLFSLFCLFPLWGEEVTFPWVVYYGTTASYEDLKPYNPILLDRDFPLALSPLTKEKKEVLGYLNAGEVDDRDPWFSSVKNGGLLINEMNFGREAILLIFVTLFGSKLSSMKSFPSSLLRDSLGYFSINLTSPLNLSNKTLKNIKG